MVNYSGERPMHAVAKRDRHGQGSRQKTRLCTFNSTSGAHNPKFTLDFNLIKLFNFGTDNA